MAERRKSDAQSVREFVAAMEREGDPRVGQYRETLRRQRSDAAKRGHASKARRAARNSPAGKTPIEATVTRVFSRPQPSTPARSAHSSAGGHGRPVSSKPSTSSTSSARSARSSARKAKTRRRGGSPEVGHAVERAGRDVANRENVRRLYGGKPSVAGSATGGAAAGAATGAALGSVVPGVGTAVGAGTGAALGGVGGALSGAKAKREYRKATAASPGARKALVAELLVCLVIVALSPLTDRHRDDKPGAWMKRMASVLGVFLLLALLSAAGPRAAKVSVAFGGLMTLVLALSQRDLFVKLAQILTPVTGSVTGAGEGGLISTPGGISGAGLGGSIDLPGTWRAAPGVSGGGGSA